ncbi:MULTISPECIES: cell division protein CrgA [Aestuariimicrobium]|uniref:cell division protein CrgA n=1 Tax=Aestuariimicrobium TaxID=396388 RepID=UPI0003B7B328|nr:MULTISPECIES: cell division protein CrgA [Aestuariimicrobium]CAI9404644.1 Cell division protein CrgA [Aestuariimicrobium sp. T2.26MG-19.2B]
MPESKSRTAADKKRKASDQAKLAEKKATRRSGPSDRSWVPWAFIPTGLLGVLWLVVYYITGYRIPVMRDLGDWNIVIGIGLMAIAFSLTTLWK